MVRKTCCCLPLQTGTNHCNLLCPPFTPLALVFTNNKHLITTTKPPVDARAARARKGP